MSRGAGGRAELGVAETGDVLGLRILNMVRYEAHAGKVSRNKEKLCTRLSVALHKGKT